jgi:hypothetical protein
VLDKFATGKRSFEDSVQAALHKGIGDHGVRHLRKFKEWLGASETQVEITSLEGEASKECLYELKKIETLVSRLLRKLNRD